MRIWLPVLLCLMSYGVWAQHVSFIVPATANASPISRQTITDCEQLLTQACQCKVDENDNNADIVIILPSTNSADEQKPTRFEANLSYPYSHYPSQDYIWHATTTNGKHTLTLDATTVEGISCGLYGLLQEKLGFGFLHARQTFVPKLTQWPLPDQFTFEGKARFDKKGFHIHSMHPLELTEQLLDPTYPNALHDVKEYINWLARNGQNYFEFNLLNSVDPNIWPAHAKAIVDYCHSRGILAGVDLSLHMIQQKAFMLYKGIPKSFKSKPTQIDKNLAWVMQAGWDYVNMEFSTTEFSKGNVAEKEKLRLHIIDVLENKYHCHLLGREHVVQSSKMISGKSAHLVMDSAQQALDKHRGILVHTVMCYSVTEDKAPVYRNQNLHHMLAMVVREKDQRETWFYPESAYWITFDISVPMMLLPYLSARLQDIQTMDSLGVKGHVTFSSGWEWGYWLVDWSIARWSWQYSTDGQVETLTPDMYVQKLLGNGLLTNVVTKARLLQEKYLKDQELLRYMAAQNPTDEMPHPLDLEFQPRPRWKYKWIHKHASLEVLDSIEREGVIPLEAFAKSTDSLMQYAATFFAERANDTLRNNLAYELLDGIEITSLRAKHRALTLQWLIEKRKAHLLHFPVKTADQFGKAAASVREAAQLIVNKREKYYRYPTASIAAMHLDHTVYHFGYLYPVHILAFWNREESQIQHSRYGPFYHILWNIPRTLGLVK